MKVIGLKGRNIGALVVMAFMTCTLSNVSGAEERDSTHEAPPLNDVKATAKRYGGALQEILQKRMAEHGPPGAVDACSVEAVRIGSEMSRETGWSIKRVTARARNPLDMPDEYEAKKLDAFASQSKTPDATLASYEVVEENGVRYARFMKGITIKPVCLTCHGDSNATAAVDQKLAELYPNDKARGYQLGDLRGALSIKIKLD